MSSKSGMRGVFSGSLIAGVIGVGGMWGVEAASATIIGDGLYRLHNHPDGNILPPPYGLRLDELVDVTPGLDSFTLNFDDPSSNIQMTVSGSGSVIHVFGVSLGGRDIGGSYAADGFLGTYALDFTYSIGVIGAAGDDDLVVLAPDGSNFGTLVTPFGPTINLADKGGNAPPFNFRLGDEDDDLGHRGFSGISGWGWLDVAGLAPGPTRDFLFTAELIPTPASVATLGIFAILGVRRRRAG